MVIFEQMELMMNDFIKELEEDIREERILILWNKYGNYLIGLALSIILVTIAYVLWQYISHNRQEKRFLTFSHALELKNQGKAEEAIKAFQELAQNGGGYGKLAQLYEAALVSTPEPFYIKISQQNPADPALNKLPKLLVAARSLEKTEALTALEPLAAPNNAWAPLSLELLALSHVKRGDQTKAAKLYIQMLKESTLTPDEQLRAEMMLSQLDVPPSLWEEERAAEAQR